MSFERARRIKMMLFDVDGVLTDGTIWLFPAPAGGQMDPKAKEVRSNDGGFSFSSATMIEAKGFNAHDGTGFSLLKLAGIKAGLITKRISETVAIRARDLKIEHVYQGQADKSATLDQICITDGITPEEIAYVGDDVIDLPAMRRCGLAIAVANARDEVKREAHWTTPNVGGHGAGRDAIEYVLRAQGRLDEVIKAYIASRPILQATGKLTAE
jgi:3-deoxy-D-manno-octulosonate 8-phosphate phosphatase (KDO 8-P phosphatase)